MCVCVCVCVRLNVSHQSVGFCYTAAFLLHCTQVWPVMLCLYVYTHVYVCVRVYVCLITQLHSVFHCSVPAPLCAGVASELCAGFSLWLQPGSSAVGPLPSPQAQAAQQGQAHIDCYSVCVCVDGCAACATWVSQEVLHVCV